jgi:hypothetical protein
VAQVVDTQVQLETILSQVLGMKAHTYGKWRIELQKCQESKISIITKAAVSDIA